MMWTFKLLVVCAVAHARFASAADSCSGRCSRRVDSSYDCQCNSSCETYGDCCTDYYQQCLGTSYSCATRCGESYNSANPCHCNDLCTVYDNCCGDYDNYCLAADPDSSCDGRCDQNVDSSKPCQCNSACAIYGDCCDDYTDVCSGGDGGGGSPGSGSGSDLSALAQSLWDADVNRIESPDLVFNKQAYLTDYSKRVDYSSESLMTLNEAALRGTWPSFMALLDNYIRFTGTAETTSFLETSELENFLDQVFDTQVMDLTSTFLISNGYFGSVNEFRAYFKNIWFTLYSRSSGTSDSSGFEHVFVGEVKSGKVSGYHNWLAFYLDEKEGNVNYYGYTSENEPNQILMQFRMDEGGTYWKELASIIYGVSPEFELAIFTTCFVTNPNALTTYTLNGYTQRVQTWDYNGDFIGSAYLSV